MKRPWQIWSLFIAGLVLVLATFSWLTIKALELDQQQSQARQDAELDQDVSRALWRMDTLLTPLLAQEAARPEPVYHALLTVPATRGGGLELSPLLKEPPGFVLIHFQLSEGGRLTSPQVPQGPTRELAIEQGVSEKQITESTIRLAQLTDLLRASELLAELPNESIDLEADPASGVVARTDPLQSYNNPPVIANVYRSDNFKQIDEAITKQQSLPGRGDAGDYGPRSNYRNQAQSPSVQSSMRENEVGPPVEIPSTNSPSQAPFPPTSTPPLDTASAPQPGGFSEVTRPPTAAPSDVTPPTPVPADPFGLPVPGEPPLSEPTTPLGAPRPVIQDPFGSGGASEGEMQEQDRPEKELNDGPQQQTGELSQVPDQPRPAEPSQAPSAGQSQTGTYDDQSSATAPRRPGEQGSGYISPRWMVPSAAQSRAEPASSVGTFYESLPRGSNDLANRDRVFQAYAQRQVLEQRQSFEGISPLVPAVEGVSRPLWIRGQLILARRVMVRGETIVQGCWLDWNAIQSRLSSEVSDLLPDAKLVPVNDESEAPLGRLLATVPAKLVLPPLEAVAPGFTPIRAALGIAWITLLVAIVVAGVLLDRVVQLSERRGAFVAAVTHELRTPLTTFRMYAEMLAEGMVSSPEQQKSYLDTLRTEADRLAHLVENVLQYARLERTGLATRKESIALGALIDRSRSRLASHLRESNMQLDVVMSPEAARMMVDTDPAAIDQILSNLIDNACKYAKTATDRTLQLTAAEGVWGMAKLVIRDHGPGIPEAGQVRLFEPFSKSVHEAADTAPGVGLGLALCLRMARQLGGNLTYKTAAGGGAEFTLELPRTKLRGS
ncbi:histidine kinase [Pirellula staleyi DSM 6068]|uniref:histidine kinase n=1 Tax=Pirellula staleyi (strain ATCC 27377 / DSM 6068 / ICPB 4128) TaxID=530564 RepID=D2R141_PIRSD|nr:HAMP domain-containing sensor histidine kinase [Pirellula staleyi]ADB18526.1 histidine kinase [Pirellula staleyi DSM 6068]